MLRWWAMAAGGKGEMQTLSQGKAHTSHFTSLHLAALPRGHFLSSKFIVTSLAWV